MDVSIAKCSYIDEDYNCTEYISPDFSEYVYIDCEKDLLEKLDIDRGFITIESRKINVDEILQIQFDILKLLVPDCIHNEYFIYLNNYIKYQIRNISNSIYGIYPNKSIYQDISYSSILERAERGISINQIVKDVLIIYDTVSEFYCKKEIKNYGKVFERNDREFIQSHNWGNK